MKPYDPNLDIKVGLTHPDTEPDRPGFLFPHELLPYSSHVGVKLGELARILRSTRLSSPSYKLEAPALSLAPLPNPQFPFPTDRAGIGRSEARGGLLPRYYYFLVFLGRTFISPLTVSKVEVISALTRSC